MACEPSPYRPRTAKPIFCKLRNALSICRVKMEWFVAAICCAAALSGCTKSNRGSDRSVGEPTGSSPQFYGEDTEFELPYSKLTGSISSRWFQNRFISDDERPWIAPDIVAELTFDDLRDGRDPAMEAIRRHLESRSTSAARLDGAQHRQALHGSRDRKPE